jgi:uncharacterized protein involved in exopolysaccharide biosynthesis
MRHVEPETTVLPEEVRGNADRQSHEVTFLEILNVILRYRRMVVVIVVLAVALALAISLRGPRMYTSRGMFMTEQRDGSATRLSGLAAQIGLALPSGPTISAEFYVQLIRSREILTRLLHQEFQVREGDTVRTALLSDLLDIAAARPALRQEKTLRRLRDLIEASTTQPGTVDLAVTTPYPELSRDIGTLLMDQVNDFNLATRQSRVRSEREFTEARLGEMRQDLRRAEDRLMSFLAANRSFDRSPELQFAHDRLQREVNAQAQIVSSLTEAYEQARIEEVRETPVITVVQPPHLPPEPDRRMLAIKLLAAVFGGLLFGIVAAFVRDAIASARERDPARYRQFEQLRAELAADLRRPRIRSHR